MLVCVLSCLFLHKTSSIMESGNYNSQDALLYAWCSCNHRWLSSPHQPWRKKWRLWRCLSVHVGQIFWRNLMSQRSDFWSFCCLWKTCLTWGLGRWSDNISTQIWAFSSCISLCPMAHHGKRNEHSCCACLWKVSQTDQALMSMHGRNNESSRQRGNRFLRTYWWHHANYRLLKENLQIHYPYWYNCTKFSDFCSQQPKEWLHWFCFVARTGNNCKKGFIFV